MNHIAALEADLEPVDVYLGDYHSGPRCAVCQEVDCEHCGGFKGECKPEDLDAEEVRMIIEQLHRYSALAETFKTARDEERGKRIEAEKQVKRLEIVAAQEHRGHALAKANQANADYREALAKAEIARLEAELVELRNREPHCTGTSSCGWFQETTS